MTTSKDILDQVEHYDSIEEYDQYNSSFQDNLEKGFIRDITLTTYNGASGVSYVWDMDDLHILTAIQHEVLENEAFSELLKEVNAGVSTLSEAMLEYATIYNVFTIGDRIYTNFD